MSRVEKKRGNFTILQWEVHPGAFLPYKHAYKHAYKHEYKHAYKHAYKSMYKHA